MSSAHRAIARSSLSLSRCKPSALELSNSCFSSTSWRSYSRVASARAVAIYLVRLEALALDRGIDARLPIDRHGIEPPTAASRAAAGR